MGHNRNLADYAHHFDGTHIDLGSGNIETQGVVTFEDVSNVDAIGIVTARAGVKVPDNQKILLGTGNDLEIFHDSTNTHISNSTGGLFINQYLDDGDIALRTDDGSGGFTNYLFCDGSSGRVVLSHYGSGKIQTSSTGATVTGTLVSDSVTSELDLSAISSSISDTATDIFIYDTSKDSDGGAWRKRTQHTSWYNETLNTSTRGSRREFPAVAVIVAEANTLTIYDGDDPDLPMWMVFNGVGSRSAQSAYYVSSGTLTGISALNGQISVSHYGTVIINMVADSGIFVGSSGDVNKGTFTKPILERNSAQGYKLPVLVAVHYDHNDVAMTVLPNAPVDDSTGLPIPTIALATNGGVSVIKDDGTIVSSAGDAAGLVEYLDNNYIIITRDNNTGYFAVHNNHFTSGSWNANANSYYSATTPVFNQSGYINGLAASENGYFGNNIGVHIYDSLSSSSTNTNGLFSNITASYNTGYMVGDIKGAFLSDTTVESLTANTNLASSATQVDTGRLTSETYDNGDTSWQMVDNAGSANGYLTIRFSGLTVGQSYIISMTWDNNATLDSGYNHRIDHNSGGSTNFTHWNKTNASSETLTGVFVATSQNNEELVFYANAITLNVTNFNIRAIDDEDRSINNKGLAVYGTVTKSAVATGADLVAYSGFSASNYLQQPYNSDFLFGTDDFCITGWVNNTVPSNSVYEDILTFGNIGVVGYGNREPGNWLIQLNKQYGFNMYYRTNAEAEASGWSNYSASGNFQKYSLNGLGVWYKITIVKSGDRIYSYTNDDLLGSKPISGSFTTSSNLSDMKLTIGYEGGNSYGPYAALYSKLALWRISRSAPSAEQVKKMYEDEKVLFQENAKATLYGSSDAVTALAYDEVTEQLHVGTSSGRSDFTGLRRINNTTTAVTTAISAHDEFIVEQ